MTVIGDPHTEAVLNRLDWQLGEAGRREHRFAWLRDMRGGEWQAVDAYYPSNRVVVIASADPELLDHCEQLVPANGFYVLTLELDELEGDCDALVHTLSTRLSQQGWVPRSPAGSEDDRPEPLSRPAPTRTVHGPRGTWAAGQTPPRRRAGDPATGVVLVLIVVLELGLGGGLIGLGAGDYVLGFGCLLDACARVLGAVAASQGGDPDAAWNSVLLGSLVLWSGDGNDNDAAALAQVTAIVAGCAVGLGLLLAIV